MPKKEDRIYRFYRAKTEELDHNTIIPVDNTRWKATRGLTLELLGEKLQVVINEGLLDDRNVSSVAFNNQDQFPEVPPGVKKERAHLSVDENYLYVWIDSKKKWKRAPLADWD